MIADLNKGFTQEELAFIQNQQLPWEHYDHGRGASGYEAGFSLGERL